MRKVCSLVFLGGGLLLGMFAVAKLQPVLAQACNGTLWCCPSVTKCECREAPAITCFIAGSDTACRGLGPCDCSEVCDDTDLTEYFCGGATAKPPGSCSANCPGGYLAYAGSCYIGGGGRIGLDSSLRSE